MTPSGLRAKIIAERTSWIRRMLDSIRALPLATSVVFRADPRNVAAAESHVRRALEALLDLGRHVLAKGFGRPVAEYKDIARGLLEAGVLEEREGTVLRHLAGYRNRLVHFYHEVSELELYEICTGEIGDIEMVLAAVLRWIEAHPDKIDQSL
jgi:uncharacterized protein YutE (UPF0331/DUF86 family)